MAYKIKICRAAQKQLLALSREVQVGVAGAIDKLADNARPTGGKKLRETGLWRVRAGRYRIVYTIDNDDGVITVVKVAIRREDTYKGL